MITRESTSGKKIVNISKTANGYIAIYCQISGDDFPQALESKNFSTLKRAEKYANIKLF